MGSGAGKETPNNFIPMEITVLASNFVPCAQNYAFRQYVLAKLDSPVKPDCLFLLSLGTEFSLL